MKTARWLAISVTVVMLGSFSEVFAVDPGTACASGAVTGVCNGISGYPVKFDPSSPTGVSALCPPYNNPFVVFSPHPDDETLATAGAIRAAKDANRQVIVELMTNGDQSGTYECQSAGTGTSGDCGKDRCREFMAAMQALGVDGVTVNNFGDKTLLTIGGSSCPGDPSQAVPDATKVPQRVQFWTGMNGTSNIIGCLSLRGTAGYEDGISCHADHLAVRLALKNANYGDTKWYAVYEHSDPDRFNTTSGVASTFYHEAISPSQCNAGVLAALNSYMTASPPQTITTIGYGGAMGAFDNEKSDCLNAVAEDLALKDSFTSCFGGGGMCGEASCVSPDGQYISHFTGPNCDGTESYYLPYDSWGYQCRPYPSSEAQCGTIHRTVTNRSYRYAGQCYPNAWPSGNTLSDFVTVYRGSSCGEASCVSPDGQYISHFTGPNCDGTESYYLPYDSWGYQCRPYPSSGAQCGTIHRTVTNRSYRYAGQCYSNAWPSGNTLSDFVTVYR
ncbi:MAG TPA: PIG-L family deacetylase [Thermoanaerobaculia bacterium]|jgi:LmbE family N-acetylglucosaminyl deacetylase|nr:PIG-L family deacetylase [Thermoanaerobaculia bacterium]